MIENKKMRLYEYIDGTNHLHASAVETARERLVGLAKPPGSLGKLEDIAAQISGITGETVNDVSKRCVIIFCSDNGIVEEGVASAPQAVTLAQTINFTRGITGVAVLSKTYGTDLMVVDMGVNADICHPDVIDRKIRKSTWNFANGRAMTEDEALDSMLTGIEMVKEAVDRGYKAVGIGEMGIGNTSTSSAVLSAITKVDVDETVGKGAGLAGNAYDRKKAVIREALKEFDGIPKEDIDPIRVLSRVGGFDIGAMAGAFIGAAYYRVPVVIDGLISAVAAAVAKKMCPTAVDFMIPSHASYEIGYKHAMEYLGLSPSLMLDMRLGEGSGCPIMFMVMDGALDIMRNMGTFAEAAIADEYVESIKSDDAFTVE
jgi:nicotinate-nucleotide--dimethylbenzimidazole phosphoribosyltransferase